MIPMDEQLLPTVLDLVPQRSSDPALDAGLAADCAAGTPGIQQLKALRAKAGLDASNPHAGHRMPGLVDAETLAAISSAGGAASTTGRSPSACGRTWMSWRTWPGPSSPTAPARR